MKFYTYKQNKKQFRAFMHQTVRINMLLFCFRFRDSGSQFCKQSAAPPPTKIFWLFFHCLSKMYCLQDVKSLLLKYADQKERMKNKGFRG